MKRFLLLLPVLCICLCACSHDAKAKVEKITPEQAKQMMDQEEVIIVDVRSEEEYAQGHILHSLNVPLDQITDMKNYANVDDTLLVYCRSGNRSAQASEQLIKNGFIHVYDFGGIMEWPYDIVK